MGTTYIMPKHVLKNAIDKSINMTEASRRLGVPFTTFKDWAIKYDIYKPNPNHRKRLKDRRTTSGLVSILQTRGLKANECEYCGLGEIWNDGQLMMQLHHKDGNNKNNDIENLEILCPNCHSQTDTYCGKNIKKYLGMKWLRQIEDAKHSGTLTQMQTITV